MKKVFLTTTILLTASTALAFGGVFSHGSKSTTYKGGVDAIGVHFGGEKRTTDLEPEETCPADKKCGNGCCQMNDACRQDPDSNEYQCCNEELDYCCPVGQGVHRTYIGYWANTCCEGKLYCRRQDANGNCLDDIYCCPPEKTVLGPFEHLDGQKDYLCCNEGEELYVNKRDSNGDSYECCSNITGDEEIHRGAGPNGADVCCHGHGLEIFCSQRDSEGNCTWANCCPGTVTRRSGPNTPDLCEQ